MRRLPEVRVPGHFNTWLKILHEFADLVRQSRPPLKRPPPSSDAITRMEEALGWLSWLEGEDAKLVWARASNQSWKAVCWPFGIARTTAWRRWVVALCLIAMKLNGEPKHRSQLQEAALRRRQAL
jgi:hypothetical protein